jgi:predicted metal-binding membrane protein
MMAPTALPAFATYDELGARAETRFGALIGGYLLSGAVFPFWPPGLQMALTRRARSRSSGTAGRRRCRAAF